MIAFLFYFSSLMKVPVFFLSFIFILLFGNVYLYAGTGRGFQYQASSLNTNLEAVNNVYTSNDHICLDNFIQTEEYKILICEEVEDQDYFESTSRKDRMGSWFFANFYDQYYVDCYYDFIKSAPFFWRNALHRYILQRTLRI